MDLKNISTEKRNPNTMNLDMMSPLQIAEAMNNEDLKVPQAISKILPQIAEAISAVETAFNKGARLIYVGAGTSGRLGVLDASECPPTFGVDSSKVVGIIAGGDRALRFPIEGAEDSSKLGEEDLIKNNLKKDDVVIGLAASGRTPYVIGALKYAKSIGCVTGAVSCSQNSEVSNVADIAMEALVGPEILTGSTRLKSGTAQKMIVNMITTGAMIRIGKAYENLMVDVVASNKKLVTRAENIVMEATGVTREKAAKSLEVAEGSAKIAIVMLLTDSTFSQAKNILSKANGHIRKALSK